MMAARFTLIAGALALSGCGGSGKDAGGNGGGAIRPPDAVMNTPEGGKAELRYNDRAVMPDGVPAYPGATQVGSVSVNEPGRGAGQVVSLQTADSPQQVQDFYAAAAERAGYRVAMRAAFGLTLVKPDGQGVQIQTIRSGQRGTVIQIVVGQGGR